MSSLPLPLSSSTPPQDFFNSGEPVRAFLRGGDPTGDPTPSSSDEVSTVAVEALDSSLPARDLILLRGEAFQSSNLSQVGWSTAVLLTQKVLVQARKMKKMEKLEKMTQRRPAQY